MSRNGSSGSAGTKHVARSSTVHTSRLGPALTEEGTDDGGPRSPWLRQALSTTDLGTPRRRARGAGGEHHGARRAERVRQVDPDPELDRLRAGDRGPAVDRRGRPTTRSEGRRGTGRLCAADPVAVPRPVGRRAHHARRDAARRVRRGDGRALRRPAVDPAPGEGRRAVRRRGDPGGPGPRPRDAGADRPGGHPRGDRHRPPGRGSTARRRRGAASRRGRGMSLRGALLSFRIHRFESTVVVFAALLSVAVSAVVITLFYGGGYASCFGNDQPVLSSLCQSTPAEWLPRIARLSLALVPIFPVIGGLLAGGPIVARELETGTARLAWSLGPSRLRWFAQRVVPIFLMFLVACFAIGVVADSLLHLVQPTVAIDGSFVGYRARGLLIPTLGLVVASIALAIGALTGRTVPTIILTLMLFGGLIAAADTVEKQVLLGEAVVGGDFQYSENNLWLDSKFLMPDGRVMSWDEVIAEHPEFNEFGWDESSGIQPVALYIPGARYHDVERREAAALLAIALAFA